MDKNIYTTRSSTLCHSYKDVQEAVQLIDIHPNDQAYIIIKNNIKCVVGKIF